MSGIKSLLIALVIMVSTLDAASPEAMRVTRVIATKARSKMPQAFGPKLNSKVEATVSDFEIVAPDIIDQNLYKLKKELASSEPNLDSRAHHKLASKYAKQTTSEIKSQMKTVSRKNTDLSKRQLVSGATELTKNAVVVMGLIAGALMAGIVLVALVGFLYATIRRFMFRATYGYPMGAPPAPIPPVPYMMY